MRQKEILNRVIWDPNYYEKSEILLGILDKSGIKYLEFEEYEVREGWLWKDNIPQYPLYRIVEIRTKDGKVLWRNPRYPGRNKSQTGHEEHH